MYSALLYADGGSRGNPGHSTGGAILLAEDGSTIEKVSQYCGRNTNNVAEYIGLIAGLQLAHRKGIDDLDVFMDSELVVKQICGQSGVQSPALIDLHAKAKALIAQFPRCDLHHIPREKNKEADRIVNECLDAITKPEKMDREIAKAVRQVDKALDKAVKALNAEWCDINEVRSHIEQARTIVKGLAEE